MRVIEDMCERAGMIGGQLKTAPAGACNTDRSLTITPTVKELSAMDATHPTHSDSREAHRRNQLALSILSHREATAETVAAAIAALKGESLPSLVLRGA